MVMFATAPDEPLLVHKSASRSQLSSRPIHIERLEPKKSRCPRPLQWCAIIAGLWFLAVTAWIYIDNTMPEFNQYRLVRNYQGNNSNASNASNADQTRVILLWNTFFGDARWSLPDDLMDPSYFRNDLKCPVFQCVLTNRRDLFPQLHMYDAVVFHTAQPFNVINPVPSTRSSRQLYIFALMEPPGETKHILSDEREFYNLTMTYRTDSDIIWAYSWFVDKTSNTRILPSQYPQWRQPPPSYNDTEIWNAWPLKSKMAAWFVSHCQTLSRRELLVKELQKFIEVDVYGKCGPYSCPAHSTKCNELLDKRYKFYFSFENALCTDYITEKLYNALERNIIPVVYGGANYEQFLPPHSYINAEEYETPKALADYLVYLSQSPGEYMRYFWWRQHYELRFFSPFCDLCQRLHQSNYEQRTQSYHDIERWWLQGSCRFKSRIKF